MRRWTDWIKKSLNHIDQGTAKIERQKDTTAEVTGPGGIQDGSQNIEPSSNTLSDCDGLAATLPGCMAPANLKALPILVSYFDFAIVNQPGTNDNWAFDNYHSFVFIDINPTPDLSFSFNLIGPQTFPVYYELDYRATKKLTLRAGKIFIPFDDLSMQSPHNIFGGREGLQQLMPISATAGQPGNGGLTFLPSLWTELGVGLKYMLVDTAALQFEGDFTVTNGFSATNGGDLLNGNLGPNFAVYTPAPNVEGQGSLLERRNKSYDARLHVLISNRLGLGGSIYTGQWNDDQGPNSGPGPLYLTMLGLDGQLYLARGVELRGGLAVMTVEFPEGPSQREGSYFELGVDFTKRWKGLLRYGALQLDNRVPQPTDVDVLGGEVLYNPGPVQFSLQYSRDIATPSFLIGFNSYTALRMIMVF